jgi:hypothetical protein
MPSIPSRARSRRWLHLPRSDLVERFDRNLRAYKQGHYNEAQARIEFIAPFFKALGSPGPPREDRPPAPDRCDRPADRRTGVRA